MRMGRASWAGLGDDLGEQHAILPHTQHPSINGRVGIKAQLPSQRLGHRALVRGLSNPFLAGRTCPILAGARQSIWRGLGRTRSGAALGPSGKLCSHLLDCELPWVADVDRPDGFLLVHQPHQPIHQVVDEAEGARLVALAVHGDVLAVDCLREGWVGKVGAGVG
eukprot:scaffold1825_cov112-Isochrysis_galbana.AAC.5